MAKQKHYWGVWVIRTTGKRHWAWAVGDSDEGSPYALYDRRCEALGMANVWRALKDVDVVSAVPRKVRIEVVK